MKTSVKIGGLIAAALIATTGVSTAAPVNPYVVNSTNATVMNPFGLCWRTGFWTPALAEQAGPEGAGCTCDKDILSAEACGKTAAAPVTAPTTAKVTLSADMLFGFDSVNLSAASQVLLDQLVSRMAGMDLEVVLATGYADRLGSEAYNQKISLARVESVRDYLGMKGVDTTRIQTEGRGTADPVVDCPNPSKAGDIKTKADLIDCLAPNRRAVIEVIGTRTVE